MRRSDRAIAVAGLLFLSCSNAEQKKSIAAGQQKMTAPATESGAEELPVTKPAAQFAANSAALNDIMNDRADAPQIFLVNNARSKMIQGRKGILVNINPADLETTEGSAPAGNIRVSLVEMTGAVDFIHNNAPTVANGKLIVSGGACTIECFSGDKRLRLKNSKSMEIAFPGRTEPRMETFYGQRDKNGTVNWQAAQTGAISNTAPDSIWVKAMEIRYKDSIITEMHSRSSISMDKLKLPPGMTPGIRVIDDKVYMVAEDRSKPLDTVYSFIRKPLTNKLNQQVYNVLRVNRLGLVNCDYFPNSQTKELLVTLPVSENPDLPVKFFVVFTKENAVFEKYFGFTSVNNSEAVSLPAGYSARLIAFSYDKGKLLGYSQSITTGQEKEVSLNLRPISDDEMEAMIAGKSS